MTHPLPPEQILEAVEGPAILISQDFRIEAANQAYIDRYCGDKDPIGNFCHEISHLSDTPCEQNGEACPVEQARQRGETTRVLHVHKTPEGEQYVDVEARPLRDEQGNIHCFVETVRETRTASPLADKKRLLVGRAPAFTRMLELIHRVGPSTTTALLLGESGTGKELAARAIHAESRRRDHAFVAVECSGLTETLFESELFGHEKGAFTGASARKKGLVESAEGGTLFLDEIGDIPLPLQVKLLRLLETRSYRPVGGTIPQKTNFRLICATHRNLVEMVEKGEFRRDLFYRISAFPITLPPLRERMEDLPVLVEVLLNRISPDKKKSLSKEAEGWLTRQRFPGNIRELRNMLERACLLADGKTIRTEHLSSPFAASDVSTRLDEAVEDRDIYTLEEAEAHYLKQALQLHQGDRQSLAEKLGVSERTLFRKLSKIEVG